jgi:small nuclear ribonucleoprotein (snRNP)-like protein
MAATIINRLKKTGQEITVKDRRGDTYVGRVSWFDEQFFSIVDSKGDETVFANNSIACFFVAGGHEKRAFNRSDSEIGASAAEDADF